MSLPTQHIREFARRLLACEADAGTGPGGRASSLIRVCEKLRAPLCTMAGVEGFRSVMQRALALSRVQLPALEALSLSESGALIGLDQLNSQLSDEDLSACAEAVLAQLLGLLILFIGEPLTQRFICDIWPLVCLDFRDTVEKIQ